MEVIRLKEWIISADPKKYHVIDAFRALHKVDWRQSNKNIAAGDIVYIYLSGDDKKIKLKCKVNKAGMEEPDIDDTEYNVSLDNKAENYMELELLEEFEGKEYTRDELVNHGFKSPQNPVHMPDSVKEYLASIKKDS